jgi:Gly-Xaa carboxypeptidase
MEKSTHAIYELPAPVPQRRNKQNRLRCISYILFPLLLIVALFESSLLDFIQDSNDGVKIFRSQCKQLDQLFPSKGCDRLEHMYEFLSTPKFESGSVARLSNAVQIRTESWDNYGTTYPYPHVRDMC